MFDAERITNDTWIYIPDPAIEFGRLHEPTNWSAAMSPPGKTSLVFEYFCFETDQIWSLPDRRTGATAPLQQFARDQAGAGRGKEDDRFLRGARAQGLSHARAGQRNRRWRCIKNFVKQFSNLMLMGRYGMFIYNNLDHSMETGIRAAQNLLGANYDLEDVLKKDEYLEIKYPENE